MGVGDGGVGGVGVGGGRGGGGYQRRRERSLNADPLYTDYTLAPLAHPWPGPQRRYSEAPQWLALAQISS